MIREGTKLTCVCGNDNSTACDLPGDTIYLCLKCRKESTLQKLVDNYTEMLKTSPAVQDPQFSPPPDPGPPNSPLSAAELADLLRPRLGHDERLVRLKSLGYTSADYHCNGRVWIGAFFVLPKDADRMIAVMENAGLDRRWPAIADLALLGDCPYDGDHRTKSDLLNQWEREIVPPLTEPEYQI